MSIALPGSQGLFSLMQEALCHQTESRIRLSSEVHAALDDFRWIARDLTHRLARLYKIVPQPTPELLGAQDASGHGMGGVWFLASEAPQHRCPPISTIVTPVAELGPILWQATFPKEIVKNLVSQQNLLGQVTNSDLELAAGAVQNNIDAHNFDIHKRTISSGSNNTPTNAWQTKGSTTTTSSPAYLLRMQAIHQLFHRYQTTSFFVPGKLNSMANDCSRLWHLSDSQLLAHFNSVYPQTVSWCIAVPRQEILSSVTSAMRKKRLAPELFLLEPHPTTICGPSGQISVRSSLWTPGSHMISTPLFSYKSLPNATEQARLPLRQASV
jgi:hypothetical protein